MIKKKSIIYLAVAVGLLAATQTLKETSEAQVGYILARKVKAALSDKKTDSPDKTPEESVLVGATGAGIKAGATIGGAYAGTWAAGKVGAALGTTIAPGVGTLIGGVTGAF